jgi:hypothetical protein
VNKGHRLFGPRHAQKRSAPGKTARRGVDPIAQKLANDLGQDVEAAERNAEHIAEVLRRALAEVLRRALKRRKIGKS